MKKKILVFLMILAVGFIHYYNLPNYRIINAMSFCTNTTRDTDLKVIIYRYRNIDETVQRIEEEHNMINGTPTTLKLRLFYPDWFIFKNEEPFKVVAFRY